MSIVIRKETEADTSSIYDLEAAAFGRAAEAELTNLLRAADALLLSHVALLDGEIAGHAAYSLMTITDGDTLRHQPALGPIAVLPAHQGRGIGSALVKAGLQAMTEAGYALLFLVGHTSYYPRFGFQPAFPQGFTSDYVKPGGRHEHFMVAVLDQETAGDIRGHTRFHPAFDAI